MQTLTIEGEHCAGPYRYLGLTGEQSTKSTRTRRRTLSQATRAAEKKKKRRAEEEKARLSSALPTFGAQPGDLARRRRGQDRRQVILLEHVQLGLVSSAVRHGVSFLFSSVFLSRFD